MADTLRVDVGFTSIFDGKTLKGWDANPKIWRVENGTLVGELVREVFLDCMVGPPAEGQ